MRRLTAKKPTIIRKSQSHKLEYRASYWLFEMDDGKWVACGNFVKRGKAIAEFNRLSV